MTISGLCLQPIDFISRRTKGAEKSIHSYVGEAATLWWAVDKLQKYCYRAEFTVLTDCSGLQKFFESEDHVHHAIRRKWVEILQFYFVILHHPARMIFECNLLS